MKEYSFFMTAVALMSGYFPTDKRKNNTDEFQVIVSGELTTRGRI